MKQPAINSLFAASKHYSQQQSSQATQEKDFIVATPTIDAKALATTGMDKKVVSLATGKKPAKKSARNQLAPAAATAVTVLEKPMTPLVNSKCSQKTATSTKMGITQSNLYIDNFGMGKAVSKATATTVFAGEDSTAALDTLSLNSAKAEVQPSKPRKRQTKKRQIKDVTKDHSEVQPTPRQVANNKSLKKAKLAPSINLGASSNPILEVPEQASSDGTPSKQSPMKGLSAATQAILKKAMAVAPAAPKPPSPSPAQPKAGSLSIAKLSSAQKPSQGVPDQVKVTTSRYDTKTEIPFSQLSEEGPSSDAQTPVVDASIKEATVVHERKPVLIPHPSQAAKNAAVSSHTMDLIKKIRIQGKQTQADHAKSSPITHLLTQADSPKPESPIAGGNLRLKHSELLKVKREIVLPLHMKQLIEVARFIDESLNFLKRCRHRDDSTMVLFSELKASVEKTFGRSVTVSNFRQLLSVVPDFYAHGWEKVSTQRQPQLVIDFQEGSTKFKQLNFFQDRQDTLRQRLTESCLRTYHDVMGNHHQVINQRNKNSQEADLIANPLKYQMWHHSFNPHTQVPVVPEASLKPSPAMVRSSNVTDFLATNSIPALVQTALAQQQPKEEERIVDEQTRAEDEKLQALAKSTGLSIETLRMIKKVEDKVTERKQETKQTLDDDLHKQRQQTLTNVANQVRYAFQMRRTGTMQLNVLLGQLGGKQTSEFVDRQERIHQIEEVAKLVPRWLQVKQMPSFGKIVKCNNNALNQLQVNKLIAEKVVNH